jgi:hypothetical protein
MAGIRVVAPVAGERCVTWAIERLRTACRTRGVPLAREGEGVPTAEGAVVVRVTGPHDSDVTRMLARRGLTLSGRSGSFALVPEGRSDALVVHGADERGVMYGVLELADRLAHARDPRDALVIDRPVVERPANRVRSVARLFCSEVEDLGWFRDPAFWDAYLSLLAESRFERFNLTLGLGYNFHRGVTDAYLYFPYPFLVAVPGYDVRVPQLPEEERERNLEALRSIADAAVARGLDFQLGLWNHAYRWIESPHAWQTVEGLDDDRHAAYCRDALAVLLDACPGISGLTFRIHGEGGVPEGGSGFWRTIFAGLAGCGRSVRLDLHAKGVDEAVLTSALEAGLPVTVSCKLWAEHMALPYHQAAIRERERLPRRDPSARSEWHRYMRISEGSRPFTRYGYADFLREDRPYALVFRVWPGTQRLLLWGDPAFAAGFGRQVGPLGDGLEWMEPLSFKGREGTGSPGSRTGYADASLDPEWDFEKYAYTYRLLGRLTYDPDAPAEVWRRFLRSRFGPAAERAEDALAAASRILPLVTVAHCPSASNNYYWPELYTDMPIAHGEEMHPYLDTPEPRRFGTVDSLDPEVFSSVAGFVDGALAGEADGRLSPLEVASRLEELSEDAERQVRALEGESATLELRRWETDIGILVGLGRFFAGKLRTAVAWELHQRTGSRVALERAVAAYRTALAGWRGACEAAGDAYVEDLTFGPQPWLRGHWRDRLPALVEDLAGVAARLTYAEPTSTDAWIDRLLRDAGPVEVEIDHRPPAFFLPGAELWLRIGVAGPDAPCVARVTLRYRPMNHALSWSAGAMDRVGDGFEGAIPEGDIDDRYPLAYAFVIVTQDGRAVRYPGLGPELLGQPYVVVRPADLGFTRKSGNDTMPIPRTERGEAEAS